MTKKFINRMLILGGLIIIIKYIIPWFISEWQQDAEGVRNFMLFWFIVVGAVLLIAYWIGAFDNFFRKNTDPFFEKICSFINRKNGGCNE